MHRSPLVLGLAALFAGMTVLLVVGAVVSGSLVALFVAAPLGLTSYVMYYHGSGKLARLVYRQHQARRYREANAERGGFGAGPRTRGRAQTRSEREARAGFAGSGRSRSGGRRPGRPGGASGPTRAEARDVLGVTVGADGDEVRRAYREKVKDVHPDRGGDPAEFKRVTTAYDRLRE